MQKFSDDAMLNALSKEQLIHIIKCTEACLAKNNDEHSALVEVAEVNRKLAMLVLQSDFYKTGHSGEVKQAVDDSLLAQANLAAVREGKVVQS